MADTKISALTAASGFFGTDELPVNESGSSKKVTGAQILAYTEPATNASTAAQTLGTSDTYLTGSGLTVVAGRLQANSFYRCRFDMTKTAASTATAAMTLRMGTL